MRLFTEKYYVIYLFKLILEQSFLQATALQTSSICDLALLCRLCYAFLSRTNPVLRQDKVHQNFLGYFVLFIISLYCCVSKHKAGKAAWYESFQLKISRATNTNAEWDEVDSF